MLGSSVKNKIVFAVFDHIGSSITVVYNSLHDFLIKESAWPPCPCLQLYQLSVVDYLFRFTLSCLPTFLYFKYPPNKLLHAGKSRIKIKPLHFFFTRSVGGLVT